MEAQRDNALEAITEKLEEDLSRKIDRVITRIGCERLGKKLAIKALGRVLVRCGFSSLSNLAEL